MKYILICSALLFTAMFHLSAQQNWFPSEQGLIRIPIDKGWSDIEESNDERYSIYRAHKGDMSLELYIAGGEPIAPKEHLDQFIEEVDKKSFTYSYYTKEVYNFYFETFTNQYIATGTKQIEGEEKRFVARSYFPDMYGVLLIVTTPEELGDLHLAEMKRLLEL